METTLVIRRLTPFDEALRLKKVLEEQRIVTEELRRGTENDRACDAAWLHLHHGRRATLMAASDQLIEG